MKKIQSDSWLLARASDLDLFIGDSIPPSRCLCLTNWITQKLFTFPPRKQSFLLTLAGSSLSTEHWELAGWSQPQMGSTFWQSHSLLWIDHHLSPLYLMLPAASACSSFITSLVRAPLCLRVCSHHPGQVGSTWARSLETGNATATAMSFYMICFLYGQIPTLYTCSHGGWGYMKCLFSEWPFSLKYQFFSEIPIVIVNKT